MFVGSFIQVNNNGATGGQFYACTTLINSTLTKTIDWVLVDSSTKLPVPNLFVRILKSVNRFRKCVWHILFSKIDTVLLFTADGLSFYEKGLIGLIGKLFGKKIIVAPRSGFIIDNLKTPVFRNFMRIVYKNADLVLCQGSSWRTLFIENFPLISVDKFKTRLNWIDMNSTGQKGQSENTELIILFLGWVEKAKGVEDLIEAISLLKNKRIKLLVGGNGSYFDEAQSKVNNMGLNNNIKFLGWVGPEDKLQLFRKADLFILPSYFEGMPNAIVEALSWSLPVIATRVGGIPDMITDGVNGFLVEKGNPNQIAEKIDYLRERPDQVQNMSVKAKEMALVNHDIKGAVEFFKEIL